MLNADQITEPSNSQRAAPEISELAGAVQRGGIPIDVIMNVMLVRVGADNKGMIAL